MPTPREIEQWVPLRLRDFVGCEYAKEVLVDHLRADGDGTNVLLSGETGTGKTALIEVYARTRNCPRTEDPLLGPCGRCHDCTTFDFQHRDDGIFARSRTKSADRGGKITNFYHVNCCHFRESEIRDLESEIAGNHGDRSIVYLDEVQELAEGRRDRLLLKSVTELDAVWIATGTHTDLLSPPFLRRFAARCSTTLPTQKELALFLLDRCRDWKIEIDCPETIGLLTQRSRQIPAECISVLARAATQQDRRLRGQLVDTHPFITGVTR
jgi:Mg-chelatase subunit ChlI